MQAVNLPSTSLGRLKAHPDVVSTALPGGDVVLLQLTTKAYFSLNSTGAEIWGLIQKEHGIDEISQCLVERFDVTWAVAYAFVETLVRDLLAENLVIAGADLE